MTRQDYEAFAEDLIHKYGRDGRLEALKRAKLCQRIGDVRSAEVWLAIGERVKAMQPQQ